MKTILPITIDDNVLVSSSVAEDDAAPYDAGTVYGIGGTCVVDHVIYSSLVASNAGHYPPDNITGTTPKWSEGEYTNRWKMFDKYSNTQTSDTKDIIVELAVNYCNVISLFNIVAESIQIDVKNSVGELVFAITKELLLSDPQNWEEYFYASREWNDVAWVEFPIMATARITITIKGAKPCSGNVIIGEVKEIGGTQYDASVSSTDYTVFSTNDFGGIYVSQGAYARNVEGDVAIESSAIRSVGNIIYSLRATPTAFFCANQDHADGLSDFLVVYGLMRTFEPTIKRPTVQEYSFKIVGVK